MGHEESFGFCLNKIGADGIFVLMGPWGTLDPPGRVKEVSGEVGAMDTFYQLFKA